MPRGKPSTPGGGAVPPNWPANRWPPGRPRPRGAPSVQTLGPRSSPHPRHSAFPNILQEIWACRIQKSLQGAWRPRELWLFPVEEAPASPKRTRILHKMASHLSANLRTWGVGVDLRKQCKSAAAASWGKVRIRQISSQDEGVQKQPGQKLYQADRGLSHGNKTSE